MLELAMAAARAVKIPAVVFDKFDSFANFYVLSIANWELIFLRVLSVSLMLVADF
jgi:hypothetical protein